MGKTRTGFVPLHSGGWFWEGGGNEKGGETEMTRQFKFIYKKRNIQEHMQITGIFLFQVHGGAYLQCQHSCRKSRSSRSFGVKHQVQGQPGLYDTQPPVIF